MQWLTVMRKGSHLLLFPMQVQSAIVPGNMYSRAEGELIERDVLQEKYSFFTHKCFNHIDVMVSCIISRDAVGALKKYHFGSSASGLCTCALIQEELTTMYESRYCMGLQYNARSCTRLHKHDPVNGILQSLPPRKSCIYSNRRDTFIRLQEKTKKSSKLCITTMRIV